MEGSMSNVLDVPHSFKQILVFVEDLCDLWICVLKRIGVNFDIHSANAVLVL